MAVSLVGAGSLFVRLGHLLGRLLDLYAIEGGSATARVLSTANMVTKWNTIQADYAAGTAINDVFDGSWTSLAAWQNSHSGFKTAIVTIAQNTLIRMVDDDTKLPQKTLANAMAELVRQMKGTSDSVNATEFSVGAQTAVGSPTGTAIVVVSTNRGDGLVNEYILPETLKFRVAADAQTGGATARQESFAITGGASAAVQAYNYPLGSGASLNLTACDAQTNNGGGNLLQNSSFESWCTDQSNQPQNWLITVGTAGTTIFNGGSALDGTGSLKFLGDGGGTLSAVTQTFGVTSTGTTVGTGGTTATLLPEVPYAFNLWLKCSATPGAGVVEVSLVDGSGTTIADSQSTNNLATKSLTSVSTSWVNVNGVFRLPAAMPSTVKLKVRLSTAIDSGKSVYIDRLSLNRMNALYTGGPYISVFSGATNALLNDTWTVAITRSSTGVIQDMFDRVFGMKSLGLILPSVTDGSETVADSLVS